MCGGGKIAQECCNHYSSMFYRRKFLIDDDIKYALTRHEEVIFLQKALYLANKIRFIDRVMFLYRNNYLSETHRKQKVEELYGPLLNSWKGLLEWHKELHSDDIDTIKVVKHMICVYAIEGVEMLYQRGIDENVAEKIIDEYFCRDFLENYENIVLSDNRRLEISEYCFHKNEFIKKQYKLGMREHWKNKLKRFEFVRKINDKKNYKVVIPKEYIQVVDKWNK